MTTTSCCSQHAIITFHPSIVCTADSSSPCHWALYGCTTITTVYIPGTIGAITWGMFRTVPNLEKVYMQDGITYIGRDVSLSLLLMKLLLLIDVS